MRIVVFGATGGTGRHVVEAALARGHEVTAVVRRLDRALAVSNHLHTIVAPEPHPKILHEALCDQDAVVSALGTNQKGPVTVCTDWIAAILEVMSAEGVRRLIAVSAFGANETRSCTSLFSLILWAALADKMRDKETMEGVISAADCDWTIVRPAALTDAKGKGRYRAGSDLPISLFSRITREDLAAFIVDIAEKSGFVRQCPTVTT
jgi:putative NADH-flavin reductase